MINGRRVALTRTGTSVVRGKASPPVSIPDHHLLRCIGRGSYGEVWLARNATGMFRAVKIVHRKAFAHQRPFEREWSGIRKFEPVAHEGLIEVLKADIHEEKTYFYCVMELGDDQATGQVIDPENYSPKTLAREIAVRGKLPLPECLRLGLRLSLALAELHEHGLVHRDLKPSNIIFVNGVPKLADIGLVAGVGEARSYVGTEGFIPPEGPGSPQADVYGLGKVLYEASTGKDRHDFPELPTEVDRLPDQAAFLELNEVILHACKTEPSQRYQSAAEMHADLLAVAAGKSVRRRKRRQRRLARCKRMAGMPVLALAAAFAVGHQIHHEWRSADEARQRQVSASVADGNRAMEAGDLLRSLPRFAGALLADDPARETTHRLRFGSVLAQCPKLSRYSFVGRRVNDGVFSPDGNSVLIAEYFGSARISDAQTGRVLSGPFGGDGGLLSAAYSPDGRFVVTANHNRSASVWRSADLEEVWRLLHPARVLNARFSSDGSRIVTCCGDGIARVWDVRTRRVELSLAHADAVLCADFSHDRRLIATASADCTARIWDAADGHPVSPPLEHGEWATFAAFSPDDQRLVTASLDHRARLWEVPLGKWIPPDLNHRDGVSSAEFSPDGRLILTASLDGTVRLWPVDNQPSAGSIPILRHTDRVTRAAFDPGGRRILTTCADGTVRIWDLAGSAVPLAAARGSWSSDGSPLLHLSHNLRQAPTRNSRATICSPLPAGSPPVTAELNRNAQFVTSILITQSDPARTNYFVRVWRTATGEALGPGILLSNGIAGAALSDDGCRLLTFGDQLAQTWNVLSGAPLSPPLATGRPVRAASFSPDGNHIATSVGNLLEVRDAVTGRALFKPLEHPAPVAYAAFNPEGSRLLTCCADGLLNPCFAQVWNAWNGRPVGARLNHTDGVLFGAFSPDGRRVVTASEDFTAKVWDATTGRQLLPAFSHEQQVKTAQFSPDGRWIVTASADRTARLWSAETGDPLTPPLRHLHRLVGARFVDDGRQIITSDEQGKSWIWKLPVDEKPAEDLRKLAQLLGGEAAVPAGHSGPPPTESLQVLWEHLRDEYPSSFTASPLEIVAWHEFQAGAAESERQWFAAAFHLDRLLALRPGDSSLTARLERARRSLSR